MLEVSLQTVVVYLKRKHLIKHKFLHIVVYGHIFGLHISAGYLKSLLPVVTGIIPSLDGSPDDLVHYVPVFIAKRRCGEKSIFRIIVTEVRESQGVFYRYDTFREEELQIFAVTVA